MSAHNAGYGWKVVGEVAIACLCLYLLATTMAPAFLQYASRGRSASYEADRQTIQSAVDQYVQSPRDEARQFPTFGGGRLPANVTPLPTAASGAFVDFSLLVTRTGALVEPPRSSGPLNASGVYTGSYNWYLDANGRVQSTPGRGDTYP